MKIKNYLTIFFAIIAIIALLLLAGYFTYLNADDSNPFKQTVTSVIEEVNLDFGLGLDLEKITHPVPFGKGSTTSTPATEAAPAAVTEAATESSTVAAN